MENLRNTKLPPSPPVFRLLQVLAVGGAGVYALTKSLFNVEGGHRAIVFNRLVGLKDDVRSADLQHLRECYHCSRTCAE